MAYGVAFTPALVIDDLDGRRPGVGRGHQVDGPARRHGALEDVVQVELGPTPEGVVDVPPVDRQDPQDAASAARGGLRATTPIVGVV